MKNLNFLLLCAAVFLLFGNCSNTLKKRELQDLPVANVLFTNAIAGDASTVYTCIQGKDSFVGIVLPTSEVLRLYNKGVKLHYGNIFRSNGNLVTAKHVTDRFDCEISYFGFGNDISLIPASGVDKLRNCIIEFTDVEIDTLNICIEGLLLPVDQRIPKVRITGEAYRVTKLQQEYELMLDSISFSRNTMLFRLDRDHEFRGLSGAPVFRRGNQSVIGVYLGRVSVKTDTINNIWQTFGRISLFEAPEGSKIMNMK